MYVKIMVVAIQKCLKKMIKYNHGEKTMKIPFIIINDDMEFWLERINTCRNNPTNSSTTKITKHLASGYSLFTNCSFDETKNSIYHYAGEECVKILCKDLKECATKIINY